MIIGQVIIIILMTGRAVATGSDKKNVIVTNFDFNVTLVMHPQQSLYIT